MTDIQVYETLRPYVGDEGARLIAEMMRLRNDLVTTAMFESAMRDVSKQFDDLRHEMQLGFAQMKAETRDWMLKFFVPLWIGVYGTLAAIVVSIFVGR